MKVFISWSGQQSKSIANAISEWLPDVFQNMEVWMSEHHIAAGSRWSDQISEVLENSNIGIICLTPDNQNSPWLLFEAGCLAKTGKIARVIPYLHGLSTTDVRYPLAQFQGVTATKEGTLKLLQSLNTSGNIGMSDERLERVFTKWWPELETKIDEIDVSITDATVERSDRELIEEVLDLVRNGGSASKVKVQKTGSRPFLTIDASNYFYAPDLTFQIMYDPGETVSDFLDRVYFALNKVGRVPAYEYGSLWVLEDFSSGKIYDDIGIESSRSRGQVRETQPIYSVGIDESATLAVVRAKPNPRHSE